MADRRLGHRQMRHGLTEAPVQRGGVKGAQRGERRQRNLSFGHAREPAASMSRNSSPVRQRRQRDPLVLPCVHRPAASANFASISAAFGSFGIFTEGSFAPSFRPRCRFGTIRYCTLRWEKIQGAATCQDVPAQGQRVPSMPGASQNGLALSRVASARVMPMSLQHAIVEREQPAALLRQLMPAQQGEHQPHARSAQPCQRHLMAGAPIRLNPPCVGHHRFAPDPSLGQTLAVGGAAGRPGSCGAGAPGARQDGRPR